MNDRTTERLTREGILRLSGPINQETGDRLIDAILLANLERWQPCLRLWIDSPGGDVDVAFAILDIMAWSHIPVRTVGIGLVASSALLIFMAGQRGHRRLSPRATLLSHRFATTCRGNHADLIAERRYQDLAHRRLLDHYQACTGLRDDDAIEAELLRPTDRWLSPDEALALGITDYVGLEEAA